MAEAQDAGAVERAARGVRGAMSAVGFVMPVDSARRVATDALAAAAPTVEQVAEVLREHQPTTGMQVSSGVTCRCGYWNGREEPGVNRPVGYQGLQWHQAEQVAALWGAR